MALAAGAALAWIIRVELMVLFAAVLFGTALYTAAGWLASRTPLPRRLAAVVTYLAAWALLGGFFYFAGQQLTDQYGEFGSRIPSALEALEERLEGRPVVGGLAGEIADLREGLVGDPPDGQSETEQAAMENQRRQLVSMTFRTLSLLIVWAALVLYVGVDGERYRDALVGLVPPERRHVAADLADALGRALPWWLVGTLASMGVVALLTAPGLMLLGVPLALLLALVAGLFSFVPFVGPIVSAIPAALIALEAAPEKVVWVLLLYWVVQLVETNVITPFIQDRMASVPPLVLIGSQLLMGGLVGVVGVMFAAPFALTLMVVVQVVWLRHTLGEHVETPRENG